MSDNSPQTPPQNPAPTGGETPPATDPQGGGGATNDNAIPEGFELIRTEDKNNLISARDRANGANSETDAIVNDLLKKDAVKDFLQENKDQYPDVTIDDLMVAGSPDELEELAKTTQNRIEDAVQKKLMDVQRATPPALSPEQKAEQLKQLKKDPKGDSFQRMLTLEQS